ncbi:hypothetical protein [Vibrio diabolicus]|uniref:hypothetical protein n=1 Tax=Vibrio diabolicus TaxID=50719 RepID=UPI00211B1D13|nr:hypothetical protein [Vibrio diabolicus]
MVILFSHPMGLSVTDQFNAERRRSTAPSCMARPIVGGRSRMLRLHASSLVNIAFANRVTICAACISVMGQNCTIE